jgi:hypothetical protein
MKLEGKPVEKFWESTFYFLGDVRKRQPQLPLDSILSVCDA